jgi:hypothetical protein
MNGNYAATTDIHAQQSVLTLWPETDIRKHLKRRKKKPAEAGF